MEEKPYYKQLRELREGTGLTLQEVANWLEVTVAIVSAWELGNSHPSLLRVVHLIQLYNSLLSSTIDTTSLLRSYFYSSDKLDLKAFNKPEREAIAELAASYIQDTLP